VSRCAGTYDTEERTSANCRAPRQPLEGSEQYNQRSATGPTGCQPVLSASSLHLSKPDGRESGRQPPSFEVDQPNG
jgi:hypothetical protein